MNMLRSLPGLDSYRGRYLYLTSFILLLISLFTYTSWTEIYHSSQNTHQNIIQRNATSKKLDDIVNQFQIIRVQLYKFSLAPETTTETRLMESITRLLEHSAQLNISLFDDIDSEQLNNYIVQIPTQLHDATINLISLRKNSAAWIPATMTMREKMLPLNQDITTAINDMLGDEEIQNPMNILSAQIKSNLHHLKISWLSIISEFRIIVSNRLGIFDATSNGFNNRLENMDTLILQIRNDLQIVKSSLDKDEYSFLSQDLLPLIENNINRWLQTYSQVIEELLQPYWRKDLLALEQIELLLSDFSNTSILLRNELNRQSNQDIQQLNDIHSMFSLFFILLSILILIIAILSYLFFDRHILLPIADTTRALLKQSTGISQELSIIPKASESRELVEAFNHMSEQIKQRESRLDFIAHHDALTMLPNRLMFNERLEHAINLTRRNDKLVILMLLDLDRFKLVNDTLGHLFGDKLLKLTAERLKKCMRSQDTIARLGGDEFAIILENVSNDDEVDKLANKIKHLFNKPFTIDGQQIHASTSIGIAVAPDDTTDPTNLIRYADIAMYQSKNSGRNQYTWFSKELENAEESIINFENQLREAISQQQFELHFQPVVNITDQNFIACEALLRWRHPDRGLINPEQFLSSIDNSELLFDLTCWSIRESAKFQSMIETTSGQTPYISFNLETIIFQHQHYRDKIEKLLRNEIGDPQRITIEVTESTLVSNMKDISATLNFLHRHGFNIALDHFGTGQSSLSHLRVFPISIIKIDKEFVRDVIIDEDDAKLVSAIISLANDMHIQVIADGVENSQQYEFLSEKGCQLMQGNWFSDAMTADEFIAYLNKSLQIINAQ